MTRIERLYQVIQAPVLTEKGTDDTADRNAYHFRVPLDANKVEIRQAVERLFNVKVKQVNTLRVLGKARRRGYVAGKTPDWKKAMVTLHEGNTIEIL
jgi:large subunit ribosomal protein L23